MIHFLDFCIQKGDLTSQTRVFTITTGQVFAYLMYIAATAVLNRCPSKKMFPNLFLHLAVLLFMGSCIFQVNRNILLLRGGMQWGMTTLTTKLVEEWTGQEGVEPQDGANRFDPFSGFLYLGGRFAFKNESVHYHHWSGFCLSDGHSCHSHVEQRSLQENVPKSVPPFSGVCHRPWYWRESIPAKMV